MPALGAAEIAPFLDLKKSLLVLGQSKMNSATACIMESLHGVVEVAHHPRRLSRSGVAEAGVVSIADDALHPRQSARRRHGLVRKVA